GRSHGQPVAVKDLARVMAAIILQLDCGAEAWGTYKYAGAEESTLYELGLSIAGMPGIPGGTKVVDEVPEWGHLEPVNNTMVCTKIRNTFGIKQLPWRTWLTEEVAMIKEAGMAGVEGEPAATCRGRRPDWRGASAILATLARALPGNPPQSRSIH